MVKDIKELAKLVANNSPKTKVSKANRTLSLKEPQFSHLQKYCKARGLAVSEVIDQLIELFLKESLDDNDVID